MRTAMQRTRTRETDRRAEIIIRDIERGMSMRHSCLRRGWIYNSEYRRQKRAGNMARINAARHRVMLRKYEEAGQ